MPPQLGVADPLGVGLALLVDRLPFECRTQCYEELYELLVPGAIVTSSAITIEKMICACSKKIVSEGNN